MTRCVASKAFTAAAVSFSEKMSLPRAKARAIAVPFTSTGADLKPGPQTGILRSRMKERCRSLDALKSTARLRHTPFFSTRSAVTRACLCLRGEAVIGAIKYNWCLAESPRAQACARACCAHDLMLVVDFRLLTDPLLLREYRSAWGAARACPPAPDTRHSAGPSVCNLTGEQATPPGGDSSPLLARPLRPVARVKSRRARDACRRHQALVGRAEGSSRTHAGAQEPGGLPPSREPRPFRELQRSGPG